MTRRLVSPFCSTSCNRDADEIISNPPPTIPQSRVYGAIMREKLNAVPANAYHLHSHVTTIHVYTNHFSSSRSPSRIVHGCLAIIEFDLWCSYYLQKKTTKHCQKRFSTRFIDKLFRIVHSVCIIHMCSYIYCPLNVRKNENARRHLSIIVYKYISKAHVVRWMFSISSRRTPTVKHWGHDVVSYNNDVEQTVLWVLKARIVIYEIRWWVTGVYYAAVPLFNDGRKSDEGKGNRKTYKRYRCIT